MRRRSTAGTLGVDLVGVRPSAVGLGGKPGAWTVASAIVDAPAAMGLSPAVGGS